MTSSADPQDPIVDIWRIPLSHAEPLVAELFELLAPEEKVRAKRFHRERDQRRFTVAHAAVRLILADYLSRGVQAIHFETADHGKPFIPGVPVQFNLSHSGELALLAVTRDRKLGVDVEEHREVPDALRIAERFFSPGEIERLQRVPSDPQALNRAFLECWTRKEAFIKAVGYGLSYPLNSFEVTFFPDLLHNLTFQSPTAENWLLRNVEVGPGYYAAIVVEGMRSAEPLSLQIHDWHPPSRNTP